MYQKSQATGKKTSLGSKKNPLETLTDLTSSTAKKTLSDFGEIGGGIFDAFLGGQKDEHDDEFEDFFPKNRQEQKQQAKRKEGNLFDYTHYHEKEVVKREITSLTEEIKRELASFKNEASALVKDAGKLAVEPVAEKPGIYHVRFLELIRSLLREMRAKVGESRTWLAAMVSKKKKRGSLFAVRGKEKGTQYSLSQELSNARSVQ